MQYIEPESEEQESIVYLEKESNFYFLLKSEAYTYTIAFLTKCLKDVEVNSAEHNNLLVEINKIKNLFENHEADLTTLEDILVGIRLKKMIPENYLGDLSQLMYAIKHSPYDRSSNQEKFENPLRRYFDSLVSSKMILNPSEKTMKQVKRISDQIINVLNSYKSTEPLPPEIKSFLECVKNGGGDIPYFKAIAFGGLDHEPTIEEVIKVLQENKDLPAIMNIHFKFANRVSKTLALNGVKKGTPSGHFADLIVQKYGSYEEYHKLLTTTAGDYSSKAYISDSVIYGSSLYTNDKSRGRLGGLDYNKKTNTLGVMRENQTALRTLLPRVGTDLTWVQDAIAQNPDYNSRYAKDLINAESVYVAGPSGMASLLLALMENVGCFEKNEDKLNYLNAICGYIVGGGFHSFAEVVSPAAFCLQLLEDYPVSPPDVEKGTEAVAPHLGNFFQEMIKSDKRFEEIRNTTWEEYINNYFKLINDEIIHRTPLKTLNQILRGKFPDDLTTSELQKIWQEISRMNAATKTECAQKVLEILSTREGWLSEQDYTLILELIKNVPAWGLKHYKDLGIDHPSISEFFNKQTATVRACIKDSVFYDKNHSLENMPDFMEKNAVFLCEKNHQLFLMHKFGDEVKAYEVVPTAGGLMLGHFLILTEDFKSFDQIMPNLTRDLIGDVLVKPESEMEHSKSLAFEIKKSNYFHGDTSGMDTDKLAPNTMLLAKDNGNYVIIHKTDDNQVRLYLLQSSPKGYTLGNHEIPLETTIDFNKKIEEFAKKQNCSLLDNKRDRQQHLPLTTGYEMSRRKTIDTASTQPTPSSRRKSI